MRIITRFFKKLTSWPLSKDPADDALVYWIDEDRREKILLRKKLEELKMWTMMADTWKK